MPNWADRLFAPDILDEPYHTDRDAMLRYHRCIDHLRVLCDDGYITMEYTDPDIPEERHYINVRWVGDMCDLPQVKADIVREFWALGSTGCIAEQGKVWVTSVALYIPG